MTQYLFQKEVDVTNDWLFYIENEARSLAQRDEFAINNYLDREIFNPEMKKFLSYDYVIDFLEKYPEKDFEPLYLNLYEGYETHVIDEYLRPRFSQFKKITRQIFQETIYNLEDKPIREIIKKVIYAYIPYFPQGFPSAFLPFIISYSAFMIKYGIKMAYPELHY